MMKKFKSAQLIIFIGCLLLFAGCGKSTSKGVFKEFDLRSKLPAEIAAVPKEQTNENVKEIVVGEPGAKMLVKWRTFKKDNNYYTLSAALEVPEDTKGIQITDASIQDPINTGTEGKVVQSNLILVNWDASGLFSTSAGTYTGNLKATGEFAEL